MSFRRLPPSEALLMIQDMALKETQLGLATRLQITPQYLCDVLQGRRGVKGVMKRLGYQQIILYERTVGSRSPAEEGGSITPPPLSIPAGDR